MRTPAWALFDELADQYDQVLPFFAAMAEQTLDAAGVAAGRLLLDVGAGRGAIAGAALARGCQVTAIDAAPRMVELISRDCPRVTAQVMDAHHLDFPDDAFDTATGGFVIHLVEDPAQVARELRRVLRPAGSVALTVPGPAGDNGRWDAFHTIVADYETRTIRPGRSGRRADVPRLLRDAGFVKVREVSVEVHLPVPDPHTCWRHLMSHGFAGLVRSLCTADAQQLHQRALAELTRMHDDGGIVLSRGAAVHMAATP